MTPNTGTSSGAAQTAAGALSVDGPQPVWMTLNEARDRAFTGEVVFELDPEVLAYFDHGVVYYAERTGGVSLGRRLLDAGVLDGEQLARGTVRVGDVEHLGRLFEREPSVDRDAVLVVAETSTENLIAELANREIAAVRVTAYRHHPSGIHRWFAAPIDESQSGRPIGDVGSIGAGLVDDLPDLTMPGFDIDGLVIEWDEPFSALTAVDDELSSSFEQVVSDLATAETSDESFALATADTEIVADAFSVVWPDGSEGTTPDPTVAAPSDASDASELPAPTIVGAEVRFEIPSLAVAAPADDVDVAVSDEVADAVRRAIAAIETATTEHVVQGATAPTLDQESVPPAASWNSFAPPTMDMRAEVLYGLEETDANAEFGADVDSATSPRESIRVDLALSPSVAAAPDAFDDGGGDNERSSALRRLIGSLRRKDR